MTMLTGRLKKRIIDCKLPDKVLLQAIDHAERGGLNKPTEQPSNPEPATEPAPKPKRKYTRRDMRAE